MKYKLVEITLCEPCLNGEGEECHSSACALWLHAVPRYRIHPELYKVIREFEIDEANAGEKETR